MIVSILIAVSPPFAELLPLENLIGNDKTQYIMTKQQEEVKQIYVIREKF